MASALENDDGSWVPVSLPDLVDLKGKLIDLKGKIDAGEVKVCSRCGVLKPLEDFGPRRLARCRACRNKGVRDYRANSLRYRAYEQARNRALARLRQTHPDEYAALVVEEEAALGIHVQRYRR